MCGSPNSLLSQGQAGLGRSWWPLPRFRAAARTMEGDLCWLLREVSNWLASGGPLVLVSCLCVCVFISHLVMSSSLWSHGLWPTKLLCPWDPLGKNTGMGCHSLLQTYPTQGSNPGLLHCKQISFPSEPSGKLTYNGESLTFQIPIFLILNSTIFNLCEEIHIFFGLPKQNSFLNGCQVQKDRNREKKNSLRTLSRAISQHFDTLPSSLFHLHF